MNVVIDGKSYTALQALQLAKLFWQQNQLLQSKAVFELVEKFLSNKEIVTARFYPLYIQLGDFQKAEALIRKELKLAPKSASANANLALCLQEQGKYGQAVRHYEAALKASPADGTIWNNLGSSYLRRNNKIKAKYAFSQAISLSPQNAKFIANHANLLIDSGEFDKAQSALEKAIKLDHKDPVVLSAVKHLFTAKETSLDPEEQSYLFAQKHVPDALEFYADFAQYYEKRNRLADSLDIINKGLTLSPKDPFLLVLLSQNLRRNKKYSEALDHLESIDVKALNSYQSKVFHYENARTLDSLGRFDEAFNHFELANKYAEKDWQHIRNQGKGEGRMDVKAFAECYQTNWISDWRAKNHDECALEPVFLIGFPRSGTTLLERVLNSHPKVNTISEKDTVQSLFIKLSEKKLSYPKDLKNIDSTFANKLRDLYFKKVHEYTKGNTVVVDKMPLNTLHVGFLHQLFPKAKFIFAQRHPYEVCLSNFMQDFKLNGAMIHFTNLQETGIFYDQVMNLWDQYQERMDLIVHTIKYECLVENFETEVTNLLDFMGLTWNNKVTAFYEGENSGQYIDTPSYHQVNRPLYSKLEYRWGNYPTAIEILKPSVEKYLIKFNYQS